MTPPSPRPTTLPNPCTFFELHGLAYWLWHVAAAVGIILVFQLGSFLKAVAEPGSAAAVLGAALRDLGLYGKVKDDEAAGRWSRVNVPKRWFWHFYVVGTVNTFLVLAIRVRSFRGDFAMGPSTRGLLLYAVQVLRRLLECLVVLRPSTRARMHLAHYAFGIAYYLAVPWTLASLPQVDEVGALQSSLAVAVGATLFFYASFAQFRCHCILGGLRSTHGPEEQIERYDIPCGHWFEVVACPHYLAEILVYAGLFLASGLKPELLAILVFIVLELGFAAQTQLQWYRRKFKDYPIHRRALIPWLF